jgi:agmatinase
MSYPSWEEIRRNQVDWSAANSFPMIARDTPTFMACPHVTTPQQLVGADVVIIGAPYVAGWDSYAGVSMDEWLMGPTRVRQQSIRYLSGYLQDLDLKVPGSLRVVDYGDAAIPPESMTCPTADNVLRAGDAVARMVDDALQAGAVPIVIGQNSPCGSYSVAEAVAHRTDGDIGMISLDTHWDIEPIDYLTMDPRVAGSSSWKHKTYELLDNFHERDLVEIGERGMLEDAERVRRFLKNGTHFYPMWRVRRDLGIEGLCSELSHAYARTKAVYCHFDMDVVGGAGPASGDILGELAEPVGMTDYEVLRVAHEIGLRGLSAFSFICIPPGSPVTYRLVACVIIYLMAGMELSRQQSA